MAMPSRRRSRSAVVLLVGLGLFIVLLVLLPRQERGAASTVPAKVQPVLQRFLARGARQKQDLATYSGTITIHAKLPDVRKQGKFVLRRHFVAPHRLTFTPVRFSGNRMVKDDVILKYLSHQAEHVNSGKSEQSGITPANYDFRYLGEQRLRGASVLVIAVRARRRGPGLFDGRIYLDADSGALLRARGRFVQSPSAFVKDIQFIEDYGQFDGFTLPVRLHTETNTQVAGKVLMDVNEDDYHVKSVARQAAGGRP